MAQAGLNAPIRSDTDGAARKRLITDLATVRVCAIESDDDYSLFEVETPPSGGFPAHIRRHEDVRFVVLEGTFTFLFGDTRCDVTAGGSIAMPRGTALGYANHGPTSARMLLLVTPGGITEAFFDEIGDGPDRPAWSPDMAHVLAVAPKYGIEFVDVDVD